MVKLWGKIVGASLGFAVGGGPFGAILGMLAGHAYDQRVAELGARNESFRSNAQQEIFTSGVVVLGAKLAKIDGRVTRAKIDAFKRAFQIRPGDEARIGRMFDNARRSAEGFEPYAFNVAQAFINTPSVLEDILFGLVQIAAADNNAISPMAADFLRSVSFTFNFSPDALIRLAARAGARLPSAEQTRQARNEVRRDGSADPYIILGITEQATVDEVKVAYRTLIRTHHPDKLIAEGKSAEFVATANEKMKRINVAYDTICRIKGIK